VTEAPPPLEQWPKRTFLGRQGLCLSRKGSFFLTTKYCSERIRRKRELLSIIEARNHRCS
jgi:hypothetical protein